MYVIIVQLVRSWGVCFDDITRLSAQRFVGRPRWHLVVGLRSLHVLINISCLAPTYNVVISCFPFGCYKLRNICGTTLLLHPVVLLHPRVFLQPLLTH